MPDRRRSASATAAVLILTLGVGLLFRRRQASPASPITTTPKAKTVNDSSVALLHVFDAPRQVLRTARSVGLVTMLLALAVALVVPLGIASQVGAAANSGATDAQAAAALRKAAAVQDRLETLQVVERAQVNRLESVAADSHFAVSAVDRSTGATLDVGADRFRTASLVKLHLVALTLWRADRDGTTLTAQQRRDVEDMMIDSENDPATRAYTALGGPADIERDLRRAFGLDGIDIGEQTFWGRSTTTPRDVVGLMDRVLPSDPATMTRYGLLADVMSRVNPEQRWGVSAAADPGSTVLTKVGWFEAPDGWIVNSSGLVMVDGDPVLMSVMTDQNASLANGIARVEEIVHLAAETIRTRRQLAEQVGGVSL